MFTGLVQAVGRLQKRAGGVLVEGCSPIAPLQIGDSVAVDGVCLTAAELNHDSFHADVSEETLARTTLGAKAARGGVVNLEPALRLSDRLGGHLVSGHVDGCGEVMAVESLRHSWHLDVRWREPRFGRYVCEKASIAIDGISLTVASCAADGVCFRVAVIPHTWAATSLNHLNVGDRVNLEVDQLARYAERLLDANRVHASELSVTSPDLSSEWLAAHGWH